jgi:hypothetical protein
MKKGMRAAVALIVFFSLLTLATLTKAQSEKTIQVGKMYVYTLDDPIEGRNTVIYTEDLVAQQKSWYTFYISFRCRGDRLVVAIISDFLSFENEEDRYFLYRFQNSLPSERRLWLASTNMRSVVAPNDISRTFFKEARKRLKGIIRHKSPVGNFDFKADFTGIDRAVKFLSCI